MRCALFAEISQEVKQNVEHVVCAAHVPTLSLITLDLTWNHAALSRGRCFCPHKYLWDYQLPRSFGLEIYR